MVFPPGYRFRPKDEELIVHYLSKKINDQPLPCDDIIHDVMLYNHTPDQLTAMFDNSAENDWFFFTSREKKYMGGNRPNRAVADVGYWKLTGKDTEAMFNGSLVGRKKTLSYFIGKQPNGKKTNWKMQEFLANEDIFPPKTIINGDAMKLNDWVLCKIYQTTHEEKKKSESGSNASSSTSSSQLDLVTEPPSQIPLLTDANGSCPSPSSSQLSLVTQPPSQILPLPNASFWPPPSSSQFGLVTQPPSQITHVTNATFWAPPSSSQLNLVTQPPSHIPRFTNASSWPPPLPSLSIPHVTSDSVLPPPFQTPYINNACFLPPPLPPLQISNFAAEADPGREILAPFWLHTTDHNAAMPSVVPPHTTTFTTQLATESQSICDLLSQELDVLDMDEACSSSNDLYLEQIPEFDGDNLDFDLYLEQIPEFDD